MSALISTVLGPGLIEVGYCANDDVLQPPNYRTTFPQTRQGLDREVDVLWVRSSFPGQPGDAGFAGLDSVHQQWEWNFPPSGGHVRKLVTGIVRDALGAIVPGAAVQLFNTTTGLLVDTQVSASDGSYRCSDPNAVSCFAVGYLTGSPDTEGTTVNTLTGT